MRRSKKKTPSSAKCVTKVRPPSVPECPPPPPGGIGSIRCSHAEDCLIQIPNYIGVPTLCPWFLIYVNTARHNACTVPMYCAGIVQLTPSQLPTTIPTVPTIDSCTKYQGSPGTTARPIATQFPEHGCNR